MDADPSRISDADLRVFCEDEREAYRLRADDYRTLPVGDRSEEIQQLLDHRTAVYASLAARLLALQRVEQLIADLRQHSNEQGWQDVDEPIAALLALASPTRPEGR